MRRGALAGCVAALALWGCDDGESQPAPARGGVDAALPDSGAEPPDGGPDMGCGSGRLSLPGDRCAEPWPCPEGWTQLDPIGCRPPVPAQDCPAGTFPLPSGGCSTPWPCPEGWARVEGEVGCAPGGPPVSEDQLGLGRCGDDPFGEHAWPEGTLYVDAEAEAEAADGSRPRPFRTLGAAVVAAGNGGTVALAAGRYDMPALRGRSWHIGGVCAERVTVEGMLVPQARLELHDLTLQSRAGQMVALASLGPAIRGARLRVRGGTQAAISSAGAPIDLEDCLIGPSEGGGLLLGGGAEVSCTRCVIAEATVAAVTVRAGATAHLDQVQVQGVRGERVAHGLLIEGGRAEVADLWIEDAMNSAILVRLPEGVLEGRRVVVSATRPRGREGGVGLSVQEGARARLEDALLEDGYDRGVFVSEGAVELVRTTVRGTRAPEGGQDVAGAGLHVGLGSAAVLRRVLLLDNRAGGATVLGDLDAEDLVIRGTRPGPAGQFGRGLELAGESARATITRGLFDDNSEHGLSVSVGAELLASDLLVRDTRPDAQGDFGTGLLVSGGARAEVVDGRIDGARSIGAGVLEGGSLTLERVIVRRVLARERDAYGGQSVAAVGADIVLTDVVCEEGAEAALLLAGGADCEARRLILSSRLGIGAQVREATLRLTQGRVSGVQRLGMLVGLGGALSAEGLLIDGVRPGLADLWGRGLEIGEGAQVSLTDAEISGAHDAGLVIADAETVAHLERVTVRDIAPRAADERFGQGIVVQRGARLEGEGLLVEGTHETGLVLIGSVAAVADLEVRGVGASFAGLADGVYVEGDSRLEAQRVSITGNAGSGLVVSNARARIEGGLISENAVGVVRQLEHHLELVDVKVEGNRGEDEVCDEVCVERPEAREPSQALPD